MSFDVSEVLYRWLPLQMAAYDTTKLDKITPAWKILAMIQPDNFGFVAQQDSTVVISICGTRNTQQWIEDFEALAVPCKYGSGQVHLGFQNQYLAVRQSIQNALTFIGGTSEVKPYDRLVILGHSLGGAMAILCAADLCGLDPEVFTFEAPRAGLFDFATWFDGKLQCCMRIENHWDIVPHVPPPELLFKHPGTGLPINSGFSPDVHVNHSLDSVAIGLIKLITQGK